MFRNIFMLFTTACVAAAMVATLAWFFRRLRKIEEDRWGKENVKPFRISFARRGRQEKG